MEYLRSIYNEVSSLPHGKKTQALQRWAKSLGMSDKTLYRQIKSLEVSERKKRKDAGSTGVEDRTLELVASMMLNSVRGNGKQTMDIPTAKQILTSQGVDIPVSNNRLGVLLREKGLNTEAMKEDSSHVRMRSLHPNHVHQVDPSLCLLYYAPDGSQHIIRDQEAYKNKPFMEGKEKWKLWRYVLVDHYSGSICHRYYQTMGENVLTLWEFLLYAWGQKENNNFKGLPEMLIWDKGSANTSKAIANACKSLRVKTIPHSTENPRAKGSVENANNNIEKLFESRLKLQPVSSVEELNYYAEKWDYAYNNNLIPNYNSEISRGSFKACRGSLWQRISKEELIELPEGAEELLVHSGETRQVKPDLTISFAHKRLSGSASYSVARLPGIAPKMDVMVYPILVSNEGKVLVTYKYKDEEIAEELLPLEIDDAGFRLDSAVFGENFKSNPMTVKEENKKKLEDLIGDKKKPFIEVADGGIKALDAIIDPTVVAFSRDGVKREIQKVAEKKLTMVEAMLELKARLGSVDVSTREYLSSKYPDGVPESEIDVLASELEKERSVCVG